MTTATNVETSVKLHETIFFFSPRYPRVDCASSRYPRVDCASSLYPRVDCASSLYPRVDCASSLYPRVDYARSRYDIAKDLILVTLTAIFVCPVMYAGIILSSGMSEFPDANRNCCIVDNRSWQRVLPLLVSEIKSSVR